MASRKILVDLGDRSYPIVIGSGVASSIDEYLPDSAKRAVVITEANLPFTCTPRIASERIEVAPGENSKSLSNVEAITRRFAELGITRNDVIVAVGGGMVTDLAGFCASCWHRGTPFVNVPSTLLGMVDASIGGKTAVNLPEGKNLVGAFWQPSAVLCDLDALSTLPDREMRCGLGEVAKYHFISGDDLLVLPLEDRIARCAEIKARIVEEDEREGGRRALLNYGHTLGHAVENVGRHRLAHGEAIAVGLIFAARLARELGRIDQARVDEHDHVVRDEYGLASSEQWTHVRTLSVDDLMASMARDKKAVHGLTFVLDGPSGLEVVPDVSSGKVEKVLRNFLVD
ncbi:MAG: 3-dehydroquinate synthase [Actinomycetota bacterium]|jgi:5-deoxy-5-amino-3-dehydroquinate synthase